MLCLSSDEVDRLKVSNNNPTSDFFLESTISDKINENDYGAGSIFAPNSTLLGDEIDSVKTEENFTSGLNPGKQLEKETEKPKCEPLPKVASKISEILQKRPLMAPTAGKRLYPQSLPLPEVRKSLLILLISL